MARSLVVLCYFTALTHAYTTFHTNCTAPSTFVNFVSSNETRGTLDILWSCLFTIIACTWTVQHLNVPEQRENRDLGWLGDIKWALKRTWTSTAWMLITALAPEVLLSKNLGDLLDANDHFEQLYELATQDGVPWTMTHSLFANMGGFVIRSYYVPERFMWQKEMKDAQAGPDISNQDPQPGGTSDVEELKRQRQSQPKLSGSNSQLVNVSNTMKSEGQGQFKPKSSGPDQLPPNEEVHSSTELKTAAPVSRHQNPFFLDASDVLALRESKLLSRLPYIPKEELNDKNKSDSFMRFITVTQIVWMVVQIIVRASRHLAISQLEIAVVAFATCAIIIYGLNWEKPKGVQVPYTLLQYRGEIPGPVFESVKKSSRAKPAFISSMLESLRRLGTCFLLRRKVKRHPGAPIPNQFNRDDPSGATEFFGTILGSAVFGAVHIAAWNFVFPTLVERTLWRSSSIISATVLVLIIPFSYFMHIRKYYIGVPLLSIVFLLYIAARLFLIVEMFRALCFLPPSAYISTWASSVPHIS